MPTTSTTTQPMTLIGFMEARQAALCLSDHDLSTALGFEREIFVSLIKAGSMRFPLNKVPALSAVLRLDAAELLRVALRESDPALAKLIEETFDPLRLTAIELAQVKHQRSLCGNAVGAPIALQGKDASTLVGV